MHVGSALRACALAMMVEPFSLASRTVGTSTWKRPPVRTRSGTSTYVRLLPAFLTAIESIEGISSVPRRDGCTT